MTCLNSYIVEIARLLPGSTDPHSSHDHRGHVVTNDLSPVGVGSLL